MKFCRDCHYYSPAFYSSGMEQVIPPLCDHPDMLDLISGCGTDPYQNRSADGKCGPSATLWEQA